MPSAVIDGRRVAWREGGTGPAMLLLHCALAHSGAWRGVMARLGDHFSIRAPDLPGHGGTDGAGRASPQAVAAADATALLAASGPAHVVGHSFGATVALRLAVEARALVRSLVLIEPVMFGFLADAGNAAAHDAERRARASFERAARAGDWAAAAAAFLGRWGGGTADASARPGGDAVARLPFIAESAGDLDGPRRRLHLVDLAGIDRPVLLLAGSASQPTAHAILDSIEPHLAVSRRAVVQDADHMAPITHPDAVSDLIAAFLRDVVGGR